MYSVLRHDDVERAFGVATLISRSVKKWQHIIIAVELDDGLDILNNALLEKIVFVNQSLDDTATGITYALSVSGTKVALFFGQWSRGIGQEISVLTWLCVAKPSEKITTFSNLDSNTFSRCSFVFLRITLTMYAS